MAEAIVPMADLASDHLAESIRPLISGTATLVTGWAGNLPVLVAVSVIAGLGAGTLNPAQQASLADVVGNDRNGGRALATVQMAADLGSITGPILAGVLVDRGSFALAFGATGAITLLAVLPWLRARETARLAR